MAKKTKIQKPLDAVFNSCRETLKAHSVLQQWFADYEKWRKEYDKWKKKFDKTASTADSGSNPGPPPPPPPPPGGGQ